MQQPIRSSSSGTSAKPHRSSRRSTSSTKRASRRNHGPASVGSRLLSWFEQRFGRSIRLQGRGMQMRLVVKKVAAAPATPQFPGMVALKPLSEDRQEAMRKDLRRLLRQHPETKKLLRHLAYVERTLRHDGVAAVDELPLDLLSKALSQLENLVVNWSALGLGEVRSRLSLLVKNKQILALHAGGAGAPTEMDHSQRADVCEVSHSVFEEMERSWRGQMPPPTLTAALTPAAAAR